MKASCVNKQPTGSKPFSDYCAIMLSEALIRSGYSLNGFKGNKCWSHEGIKHALLAEQLAEHLKSSHIPWLGKLERINPSNFQSLLKERTGIIFFKDYWQRGSENTQNMTGDHIDLWNMGSITSSGMIYRSIIEYFGLVSDLNKSKEVWFWEVK
jgi:hypothetical protein